MYRKLLSASALLALWLPITAHGHEIPLTFEPLEGQSDDQLIADRRACEEKVAEDFEEPHPLRETEPLERRPDRSGTAAGAKVGGVGVGVGVGGSSRAEPQRSSALAEAEHLNRHNRYETAMRACMQEKGYEE